MSTIPKTAHSTPRRSGDPFRLGWRYERQTGTDGRRHLVMVPLTREDILHPREGDHIVNDSAHAEDVAYLSGVFQSVLVGVVGAVVLSDVGIYWDDLALGHHSPDISVIFGARQRRHWPSFHVRQEGVRPTLLMELTSDSTRLVDLRDKRREYYRAGVEFYVIVDLLPQRRGTDVRELRVLGYRRGRRGYTRLELNAQGRLWLEVVGVWLGTQDGRVVCYDRDGQRILNIVEERQARAAAEERVRQLEEELRRRNGGRR